MRAHARPLLGLVYLLTVALLIGLSVQVYRKAMPWQRAAAVEIETRQPGLELNPQSDVKFQGVRVGEVREVTSDGTHATVRLAIDPDRLDLIPADVDAMIVPKTLFGEKFVDLRAPAGSGSERLADGDRIEQSQTSVELGMIFDRLVPLLETLDPAQLSTLLGSLAEALDGRGAELAATLRTTRSFLRAIDPSLGTLVHDLRQLATTADVYADAAPDLIRVLDDSATISTQDLVPHEQDLAALLDGVTDTATTTEDVLRENAGHLVALTGRSRPVLELLDTYAEVVPCVLEALRLGNNLGNQAAGVRGPMIGLSIDMVVQRDPYTYPDDLPDAPDSDTNVANLPDFVPSWDPHCPRLPERLKSIVEAAPYSLQPYGQAVPPGRDVDRPLPTLPTAAPAAGALAEARTALARAVAAQGLGVPASDVPDYATLLVLPLVSEGEVLVR
ncbi:MAG: MCE family protein [Actinobacteria bacterium]|uniref:Unannotated protein n=1 Tax=freshwater metagenome TaxID=449393 RepID=A0A6J6Q0M5_9ZZZZ|nr:MCE family protein [Actinomycetota bacterium]